MKTRALWRDASGFTLVEMIVVVFLLAIAMLGILAVFDASARINKSEQQVADAQGNVRFGINKMTTAIRMAGSGGLHVRQAILKKAAKGLLGISPAEVEFDNVPSGTTVHGLGATEVHRVRQGTDMIEVRGVIFSPLYSLLGNNCGGCTGTSSLVIPDQVNNLILPSGIHFNNDNANRPQFASTLERTSNLTNTNPMFFFVASSEDQSFGCSTPPNFPRYPQPIYNVALLDSAATVSGSNMTVPNLKFANGSAELLNGSDPTTGLAQAPTTITNLSRGGILDDVLYFIDDGAEDIGGNLVNPDSPKHPVLAQGIRRGDNFDVVPLADDVEDMQIAYGIDLNGDGVDPAISSTAGADEWTPNVAGEAYADIPSFVNGVLTCPNLHSVMISLLAKSRDPDPTYHGPTATGYRLMNVPVSAGIPVTAATPGNFRRRVQTLRIALRNYGYEEP